MGGHFVDDLNCQKEKIALTLVGNGESLKALEQAKKESVIHRLLHVNMFLWVSLEMEAETWTCGQVVYWRGDPRRRGPGSERWRLGKRKASIMAHYAACYSEP